MNFFKHQVHLNVELTTSGYINHDFNKAEVSKSRMWANLMNTTLICTRVCM